MSRSRAVQRYLDGWAEKPVRPLSMGSPGHLSRAVVIPALSERDSLFATLADLARQPEPQRSTTLVVVVVNNRRPPLDSGEDIRNNRETLEILGTLIRGEGPRAPAGLEADLACLRGNPLRLAAVDASSPGCEIPNRDGVGLARKIGLDLALALLDGDRAEDGALVCLDADTRVDAGYLAAVDRHFRRAQTASAVIDFSHRKPEDPLLRRAILHYEIFLRGYVLGLGRAGSPYAFHTVGSTIACTGSAYAAVRGMSRRRAGEDFYFLNKLAKLGPVGRIGDTTVRPSPRPSLRVPFGTGRRMSRVLSGESPVDGEFYHPEIFRVLGEWIGLARENPDRSAEEWLERARGIHPVLGRFLEGQSFPRAWETIRRQAPGPAHLTSQFHGWFDAFRTLRAVHALRDGDLPNVPLLEGVEELLEGTGGRPGSIRREDAGDDPAADLLAELRLREVRTQQPGRFHP